ncbi:MAG TPA: tetratricopeptide repeat protein [Candidatus Angelobacter sp.]|jgi:cytochrome c-type biogenesis protein CcmH/NrfG|nr:tetratricopeptide repeat protein [Candidatus Angelobacter sp.]
MSSFHRLSGSLIVCLALFVSVDAVSQVKPGGGGRNTGGATAPPNANSSIPDEARAVFIRGKVVLSDGSVLGEPIAIERVCNGASRRETYTDFKGHFEFQFGQQAQGRDATESGRDVFQNSGNRGPTQGMGSEFGISQPSTPGSADAIRPELLGCELRASVPGFKSTSVILRPDGSTWSIDAGTIVLTRMDEATGATISLTTMKAPEAARKNLEKAEKAIGQNKFDDAEKALEAAVKQYPEFAAAWSMLGEVQRHKSNFSAAQEDYKKAIAADPKFVNPYFGLAVVAVHEQNWPDTLKYTDEVARLNPAAFPLSYMYNAAANFYTGKIDAAEASAKKFRSLDTRNAQPDALLLLCNILTEKRDYAGAAQQLKEYLKLVPNAANASELQARLKQLESMQ